MHNLTNYVKYEVLQLKEPGKFKMIDKIIGYVFLAFVFGVAMLSYMSSHSQSVINGEQQSFAMATKHLELNLNTKLMSMEFLASDPEIKSLKAEEIQNELIRPVEILKFFNVGVVDRQGVLIAEVRPDCIFEVVNNLETFNKVLAGQIVITDVGVCKGHKNINLCVPIYGDDGEVKAVLVGVMLFDELAKLVNTNFLASQRYIFIKDGNNNNIYYPEGKSDSEILRDREMDFTSSPSGIIEDGSMGYAKGRLYIYNTVENSNWKIIMVVPMMEIYKLVLEKSINFFLAIFLLIVCGILLYRNYRQQQCHDEDRDRLRMERLLSVNQLAAGIAHEIRNPLTSIKGFIQLMARRPDRGPNLSHMDIILTEIDRIDKLVGEFQLLTRPLKTPNYIKIDIEKMINNIIILMESQAVDKSVALQFISKINFSMPSYLNQTTGVILPSKVYISGDETQLKQVFINLIKNAIEVVDGNGKVDITLSIHDNMAIVTVVDNGMGMPEEILRKIGTPFFTTKDSGNGLGLSICYNIIHSHGGEIEVDSEVGNGTKFSIMLPYVMEIK